ncbi:MAG: cupin domain-containing protein [Campylobacterota bacterium]|nr:cupin domain-containing protein [Campylobacterota bacterium]
MNLFDYNIPQTGETFDTLLEQKNIKIVRIVSSDRLEEKVYSQEEDEWVVVLEGESTLLINNEEKHLNKGDTLFIPAQTPHSVLNAANGTLWLTVHLS